MSVTEIHYPPSLVQAVALPRHDFLESLDEASWRAPPGGWPEVVAYGPLHPMAPRGHGVQRPGNAQLSVAPAVGTDLPTGGSLGITVWAPRLAGGDPVQC